MPFAGPLLRRSLPWLLAATVVACGSPTAPTAPTNTADFVFRGTVTRTDQPFHDFTAARNGVLTASVAWAAFEPSQTVCVGQSNIADRPATCAMRTAGTTNAVNLNAAAGTRFMAYAVPSYENAQAAYTIEIVVR